MTAANPAARAPNSTDRLTAEMNVAAGSGGPPVGSMYTEPTVAACLLQHRAGGGQRSSAALPISLLSLSASTTPASSVTTTRWPENWLSRTTSAWMSSQPWSSK